MSKEEFVYGICTEHGVIDYIRTLSDNKYCDRVCDIDLAEANIKPEDVVVFNDKKYFVIRRVNCAYMFCPEADLSQAYIVDSDYRMKRYKDENNDYHVVWEQIDDALDVIRSIEKFYNNTSGTKGVVL